MLRVQGTFLASRLARKVFIAVFLATSTALVVGGALVYQMGDYLVRSAAREVLTESTRAVGRNMLDRLIAAEMLLRVMPLGPAHPGSQIALDRGMADVFLSVAVVDGQAAAPATTVLRVQHDAAAAMPELALLLAPAPGRPALQAVLQRQYTWDHAVSALYQLCIVLDASTLPHCQRQTEVETSAVQVQRQQIFRPRFDADPWTLVATASPELSRLLPVSIGALVLLACTLAFLAALVATSVYLRRLTGSLDQLMSVTREAQAGDLSRRVPVGALRDEFRELAGSFNAMMAGLQDSFGFQQLLSRIDAAVLERRPLDDSFHLLLRYADAQAPGIELRVLRGSGQSGTVYRLGAGGQLQRSTWTAGPGDGRALLADSVAVGQLDGAPARLEWRGAARTAGPFADRLADLGKRLAIAADAASYASTLSRQATTDVLTGLSNRFGFVDHLGRSLGRGPDDAQIDVAFCDLDRFKEINDAYGHSVGDELLARLAERMSQALSALPHHLARLGGDEFALTMPRRHRDAVLAALRGAIHAPVDIGERRLELTASIGVASFPEHARVLEELLRKSDLAMYRAKADGGGFVRVFTDDMNKDATDRMRLLQDLREAIANGGLSLVYQPRVTSATHQVRSVEALMRWHHPRRGWVPPSRFIPLAEEAGLIDVLGDWALEQTCLQHRRWQAGNAGIRQVSVNVSPLQLRSEAFFARAQALLAQHGLPRGAIELEITEGALVQNLAWTASRLAQLQEAGFTIALDDFGVGFSSLSYLRNIPFDTLKIDKSFVDELHTHQTARAIATAIVTLARTMGKHVVAEGVETEEQARLLQQLGVDELQGYYFAKPMAQELVAGFTHEQIS